MMAAGTQVLRLLVLAIGAIFRPKALLIAENLRLRQQLVVLGRRHPRSRLGDADRRFRILASRWFGDWRNLLLIVKPETVLGWQRAGWRAYWRWRSSRQAPRFLIHDRDSRYGASFDRRVRRLGIRQVRTPFRSPRANAIAERWVRSARSECLDHLIVISEANLRRVLSAHVTYYNHWRPHRSLGQAAPCGGAMSLPQQACRKIAAAPVLGGLHHIYRTAA
jgi:hypothetical protein